MDSLVCTGIKNTRSDEVVWSCFELVDSIPSKIKGIMFREKFETPLVFRYRLQMSRAIHSHFCKVRFDVLFLDSNKVVRTIVRNVPPSCIIRAKNCAYIIEAPANSSLSINEGDKLDFL